MRGTRFLLSVLLIALSSGGLAGAQAPAADVPTPVKADPPAPKRSGAVLAEETAACVGCHKLEAELETDLESEEVQKLSVDVEAMRKSVHGKLACSECHVDLEGKVNGHRGKGFKTLREYTIFYSNQCKDCHFANYAKTLDGVHHKINADGKAKAAVCVDCHGSHLIAKAAEPRSQISLTCAVCHEKIAATYVKSVHGKSLTAGEDSDAPTCTDCHRAHDIADPRENAFRLGSPQLCGTCHTDEKMMKKYGLSTRVLDTYLSDFHGSTTLLQAGADVAVKPTAALCTDCHGVHDITKVDDPASRVVQANLVKTCQKCHPDATADFPKAWASHYDPTFAKAPLVAAVQLFYDFLIPFMIGGLVLQILLHLWRIVVNR